MATLRFLLKRFAAQRLLGLAVVITLAFSVGVLVAGPIYADAAREAIFASQLTGAAPTVRNARFQVFGDDTFDWTTADDAITDRLDTLPTERVVRQGLGTVRLGSEQGPSSPLLAREGIEQHLEIEGEPPSGDGIVLHAGVAELLGVEPGDDLGVIGPTDRRLGLRVVGTYDSPDPADPFWFGSQNPFPAPDSTQPQPALVDLETLVRATEKLELTSQYSWDAYLALTGVPFDEAQQVPDRIEQVFGSLQAESTLGLSSLDLISGLNTLLDIVRQRVADLAVPILLVVFQIGAVTLAVLAGVGALALTRQGFELAVLHSRGFRRSVLLTAQAVQAVFAAIVAFPLGLLVGMGLAALASTANGPDLPGVSFPIDLNRAGQLLGLVAAVAGALILLGLSIPYVSRTVLEERRAASREDRPLLARVPVELFVIPLGIFAFLQLRTSTRPEGGSGELDPLILIAPTLLLFGGSFLALRLLLLVFRGLDARIGRSRRLSRYLAGRRVGRSPGTGFAAALLLLLSMGLLVVSTSYRAIVLRNHQDAAHAQVGADWRVGVTPPDDALTVLRTMPPGTTPVVRAEPRLEAGSFNLPPVVLGIDPASYEQAAWWREDFSTTPLPEILRRLETPSFGMELAEPTDALTVDMDSGRQVRDLQVTATGIDADGRARTAPLQRIEPGLATYELPLEGAVRLLSITIHRTSLEAPDEVTFTIGPVEADGEPLSLEGWQPLTWRGSAGTVEPEGSGVRYEMDSGASDVIGGIVPPSGPLPALVSPAIASADGPVFPATLGGQETELEPVAQALQFPSTVPNTPFIVVSGPALLERAAAVPEAGLVLNEVWAEGDDTPILALEDAGFIRGAVARTAPIEGFLAQLPQSLALGMNFVSAAAGATLVVVGVAAALYFAQRRRDYEFAALRAMGAAPGQIVRTLALEQLLLLGFAVVAGLGLGYLLLRLLMPYVGPSISVAYPPPVFLMDWTSLGIALVVIAAATAVALALSARTLLRASVTGVLRGEAE
ncbi:MAG TPA: FtsX-like permease family protein [Actinomycetota bacterium]|nr:FtsX-like permease family protein [Actinomycetota bacterium]